MGPSQTSREVDEMLARFVSTGSTTLEGLMATDHKLLDQTEDMAVDESNNRIDAAIIMQHGEYTGKSLRQVYTLDKSYVNWVRGHANRHSCQSIMQLRVYINDRDMQKSRGILEKKAVLRSDGPMPKIEPNFDKNREKLTALPRGQRRLLKFLGRKLKQKEDFSIECDQEPYASSVKTAYISREHRREREERLNPKELTQFRAILGAANWLLVGSTRPDLAATNALRQQRVRRATVADLIEVNRMVGLMRDFAKTKVVFRSIPLLSGVFLLATDASSANAEDLRSQAAYMTLFADSHLKQEQWSHVTPLRWKSFKLERHTQSTLGAELITLARDIAECDWMRSLFAEAVFPEYTLEEDAKYREWFRAVITVDNKPIYDHAQGDGIVVKDKHLAIDMLLVRRGIRRNNMCSRWVDTRQMIVDASTKVPLIRDF